MAIKELREKRANLVEQARDIQRKASEDGRELMTQEEVARFDAFMDEVEQIGKQVQRMEALEDAERALSESQGRKVEPTRTFDSAPTERRVVELGQAERGDALRGWLMKGTNDRPNESLVQAATRCGIDVDNRLLSFNLATRALRSMDPAEVREWESRALTTQTGSSGGNTVPDEVMRALEIALLRFGGMRQVADIIRTASGADLPWPTTNDTGQSGEIVAENAQVSQQDVVFGQAVLKAYKYSSKMILVPVELLQDSAVNIPEFLGTALGQRIGRITNAHFTTGTGTSQPQGVVTGAAVGVTGSTGSATSITYANLVALQHSVDPEYRAAASWMFHDTTLRALKQMVDTTNRPLWLPGVAVREPDTILGHPYVVNQQVAAMAANARSIVFGDLGKYKIRDVQEIILRRLDERFADYHQVAFLAFSRHDGRLLDAGTNPVKVYINSAT
jgi:HK97 family phage major capsid protein